MAVTMKNAVFWDVIPCGSCKDPSYGGTYRLHHKGDMNRWTRKNVGSSSQPTHTAIITHDPSSPILLPSSETSVLTRATRLNIPEESTSSVSLLRIYATDISIYSFPSVYLSCLCFSVVCYIQKANQCILNGNLVIQIEECCLLGCEAKRLL
jgi:hypothetical protein